MSNQELFQALQIFQRGVQDYGIQKGVNQAADQMQQINNSQLDELEKRQQLGQLSNKLALHLTGLGANASQVQAAFQAIAPALIKDAQDAYLQGALSKSDPLKAIGTEVQTFENKPKMNQLAYARGTELMGKQLTADAMSGKADAKANDALAGRFTKFSQELDPNRARTGNLGSLQQSLNLTDRIKGLVGKRTNLDQRETEELAISLQKLLSGSNVGSVQQVEALVPKSARGNAQKMQEFLLNSPQGLQNDAFVQRIMQTVEREHGVVSEQLKKAQYQKLSGFKDLATKDPEQYKEVLSSYGLDPEEHQMFLKTRQLRPAGSQPEASQAAGQLPPGAVPTTVKDPSSGRMIKAYRLNGKLFSAE